MLTVVLEASDGCGATGGADSLSLIDEILREGARRMLAQALQSEVDAYLDPFVGEREPGQAVISDDLQSLRYCPCPVGYAPHTQIGQ